tara:strand:- start:474 stop:1325 length:852 start_codon:yes stop_codon:yes gene_type:complete
MKDKLLVCTFSGGRTSAFMGQFLNNYDKYKDYDKLFVFANTGKEKEETLEFIDRCDKEWNLGVVWLEAKINKEKGKGTDFKVVDFKTASRNGEPFEEMLKAYPIPTVFASNCTRELKQTPINKYVKNLGYKEVITAMGIRYDERHRKSNTAKQQNIIYPLCDDIKVDSSFIRNWWDKQCFDLDLKDYEGNCDLCFKKSLRKRLTLIKENPSIAKWWLDMENKYSSEKLPRFDLRNNFSIEQLIELSKQPFKVVKDKHDINKQQASLFNDLDMDIETDCFCKAT